MGDRKQTLVLDFDGVLHSYSSGWKGAAVIPDPPVPGALEALVGYLERFEVAIVSSRSHQWGGRRATRRWLVKQFCALAGPTYSSTPGWWARKIAETAFADPWDEEVQWAAKKLVGEIGFPRHKPPAIMTIDDRGYQFNGTWPSADEIAAFRPWYKRS